MEKQRLSRWAFYLPHAINLPPMAFKQMFLFCFLFLEVQAGHAFSDPVPQQVITGTVTDSDGLPLPGVNVLEKGTGNGTLTDFDGNYSIEVSSADADLVFSFVGMATVEIAVDQENNIDVQMQNDLNSLNEVVVVGYGTQRKETLTGAVSNITNEEIQTTTHTSLAQRLQGKVAGLQIRQNNGEPGNFDSSINIRGFGSPIYVIDGIRREGGNEFQRLNPADIESISVLKDASAAIYGLGAANGVILVTTKKGQRGKPRFSYNTIVGAVFPTSMPEMATAGQYVQLYNDSQVNRPGGQPYYSQEELQNWIEGAPGYESTDWYDLTMKDYSTQVQHNLSASGGNESTNYFVSLGYVKENGLLKSEDMGYERYNLRSNLTTDLTDNLEAQLLIGGRFDEKEEPGENFFNIFKATRVTLPTERAYANNNPLYPAPTSYGLNPVAISERDITGYTENVTRNFQSSLSLTYTAPFLEGLSIRGVAAYDANNYQHKNLFKPYDLYTYNEEDDTYNAQRQRDGTGNITNHTSNSNALTLQGYLMYEAQFNEKHNVNTTLVVEQNTLNDRFVRVRRYYRDFYTKDQLRFADQEGQESDGLENRTADLSYIGRFNYDYDGKYLFEVAGRYMGSYQYAPSNRWGFYPVGSVGWIISEEDFVQDNLGFLSNLKVRGSYGVTAQPAGAPYQYVPGYTVGSGGSYEFEDGSLTQGISAPDAVNDNLTWMTAKTADIGIDLGLWENSFSLTADVYERRMEGIPARRDIALPNTYGGELPEENLNSNLTRGFEMSIGFSNQRNYENEFQYRISANFNYARTKNLHVEGESFTNSWDRYRNQQSNLWNDIQWGYTYIGQFQSREDLLNAPMQNGELGNITRELPGDFMYADLNNDGLIDGQDEAPIFYGGTPKMHYGLTFDASWKGFDLNVLLQGSARYTLRFNEVYAEVLAFRGNTPAYFFDRWRLSDPYNPNSEWIPGTWPATRARSETGRMYAESEIWRRDASYVRLKSLEIGYTFDSTLLENIGIENFRLYSSGFNLFTIADPFVKPFDPEKIEGLFNAGYTYPVTMTVNLGVNINF